MVSSRWWHRDKYNDRRAGLLLRAQLMRAIRVWFWEHDFVEVEPDILQRSPGNETHLHGLQTRVCNSEGKHDTLYLHTSPEFAMKKLLAAGETKIFALPRVFRDREDSPLHLSEFTMLEWYRAGASFHDIMADCTELLARTARLRGAGEVHYRERACHLDAEPEQITVQDAFERYVGIDLLATLQSDPKHGDRSALVHACGACDIALSKDDTWSDIFSKLLTTYVEPNLGIDRPTFLTTYPLPEAALARTSPNDARVGERFELYCCGIELANGFGELTDTAEQRRRFQAAMNDKQEIYGERYPIDEDFLSALEVMPDASGAALGFDRLAMLTAGATRLDQMVWTPTAAINSGA